MAITRKRKTYRGRKGKSYVKRRRLGFKKASTVLTKTGPLVTIPSFGGVPPRFRTRLCYDNTATGLFDGVGNTVFNGYFRLNSLFDFDWNNNFGNYQPGGRDRLAALYNFLKISKVHLTIELCHTRDGAMPTTAPSVQMIWSSWLADAFSGASPAPASYPTMLAGARVKTVPLDSRGKLSITVDCDKLTGMGGTVFNAGTGAVEGTNPGNPVWGELILSQDNIGGGGPQHNLWSCHVRAVFDVEYSGPKKGALDTN